MIDNQKDKVIIWTAFLYLTLVWGSTFILNKRTLITFTSIQAASLRLSFAMSVMIWFVKPHWSLVPKEKRFHLVVSALTGICIPAFAKRDDGRFECIDSLHGIHIRHSFLSTKRKLVKNCRFGLRIYWVGDDYFGECER
jgi:hypothetical protein